MDDQRLREIENLLQEAEREAEMTNKRYSSEDVLKAMREVIEELRVV